MGGERSFRIHDCRTACASQHLHRLLLGVAPWREDAERSRLGARACDRTRLRESAMVPEDDADIKRAWALGVDAPRMSALAERGQSVLCRSDHDVAFDEA